MDGDWTSELRRAGKKKVVMCVKACYHGGILSVSILTHCYISSLFKKKSFIFPSKQKEMDKTKSQRDYEEKLIVSAWYNMVRRTTTSID